ncbi:aquaporin-11-like isoform X2 [Homarus americanus]|uniref:Aquaporin-11-like 1 n=2 Tax=Homarus americanus TaxID=6706 RepID=A0A8J5ML86_HOMAM|nr:aquaporin-11-like isoform X2 [Homarus americanus]XP_042205878.1 aquaporin-11-like isoform X2 [Homarus americanus]XP_042205879.1 aquaporin-11-like isoform X2 [Homarus americanus]XP_042205880.1 aquaporin-11-like isoform X2 [Homarus americanus]KAG7155360.1 Aquaporin-11-like 1 [Homarus americanus]
MALISLSLTIGMLMVLSHVVRGLLRQVVHGELVRGCLAELVAAAEMVATSYEMSRVFGNHGIIAYSIILFLTILWRIRTWDGVTACPYSLLGQYVEKGAQYHHTMLKILAQLVGGVASIRWVKYMYTIEVMHTHTSGDDIGYCESDIQVPVVMGFLIEGSLTCVCELASRALGEIKPKYAAAINSFFVTSMVLVAFNHSGGYFNPVLATCLKWSCRGHTNTEHIIVYWAGSILGAMLSIKLWNLATVKKVLVGFFKPKEE